MLPSSSLRRFLWGTKVEVQSARLRLLISGMLLFGHCHLRSYKYRHPPEYMNTVDFPKIKQLTDLLKSASGPKDLRQDLLPYIEEIAKSDEIDRLIKQIFIWESNPQAIEKTVEYRLVESGIILAQTENHFLLFSAPTSGVMSRDYALYYPSDKRIFANYSNTDVCFESYRRPAGAVSEIFRAEQQISSEGRIAVAPRQCHVFDDDSVVVDFSQAQLVSNLSLVYSGERSALRWIFDSNHLRSLFWTIGDRHISVLRTMVDLLGRFGIDAQFDGAYTKTLQRLSEHQFHIIRWTAIQGISGIDFDAAKPLLLKALKDRHPDISSVAKRIVEREKITQES